MKAWIPSMGPEAEQARALANALGIPGGDGQPFLPGWSDIEALEQAIHCLENTDPAWTLDGGALRVSFLRAMGRALEGSREELMRWALKETLYKEDDASVDVLSLAEAWTATGRWLERHGDAEGTEPAGIIALLADGSDESCLLAGSAAMAGILAAGCTVIYATLPGHLGLDHALIRLMWSTARTMGISEGVVQMLAVGSRNTMRHLIQQGSVKGVVCAGTPEFVHQISADTRDRRTSVPFLSVSGSEAVYAPTKDAGERVEAWRQTV